MPVITITVYDEGRKHYEKFECESSLFLSSMRFKYRLSSNFANSPDMIQPYHDNLVIAAYNVKFACRYFREHVKSIQTTKDCELSVYCDVSVFSWLMSYIKSPDAQRIDDQNIIAILVSSSFLQMDALVAKCSKYVSKRCCQLLAAGVELASLADDLLRRLAQVDL